MVKTFNDMHSNVTVKFVPITTNYYGTLETELSSNSGPGVFYMENDILPEFVKGGYLMDLSPVLTSNSTYNIGGFAPQILDTFMQHDQLYAAPKDWSPLFVLFNKNIFNAEHVPYPTNYTNWNWTNFHKTLVLLKDNESMLPGNGKGYYPMVLGPQFARILAFMHEAKGQWINAMGDGASSNSNGLLTAIKFWYGLYSSGLAGLNSNLSAGWNGGDFASGKVGMVVTGTWTVPVLEENGSAFKNDMSAVGYAFMPYDVQNATMMFNVGLAINSHLTSTQRWIAEQFVMFFTGPAGEKLWVSKGLALPSRTSILESSWYKTNFPIQSFAGKQFPNAYGWNYNTTNFQVTESTAHSIIVDLFAGKITPEQAYNEIINETNANLKGTSTL
ncbi:extracellular solute-binding protein [Picrophilus oshimae]|uniref:Maltose ABC transporter solute binding protein n=1 Tax=Picrophilus torridus (strain ATCC 700027 / DSM 9790 / JCM 10055 / NBRC 100828 / KAW 2/3) TaxID=1122961 RepID=Q6L1I5_PICTO|nr:extracellular solute-binding protein [Picrophilus oshimae]AAT43167.1 maltose ABC transporter solute binding protein [Picrophilus oshimae DSM 9789]